MNPAKVWIAVDFDGTLARSITKDWKGQLGEPIQPMLYRVKDWLARGINVRIFTARITPWDENGNPQPQKDLDDIRKRIGDWCEKYVGRRLDIVYYKDHNVLEIWDDRAVGVVRDTGERIGGEA